MSSEKGENGHRDIYSQRENDVKTHRRWPGDWNNKYVYKPRNTRDSQKLDKVRKDSPLEPSESMVLPIL